MNRSRSAWLILVLALVFAAVWLLREYVPRQVAPNVHQKKAPNVLRDGGDITVILDVNKFDQQGFNTCWAACGAMVMDYLGPNAVPVCEQAAHAMVSNSDKEKCCQSITLGPCDRSGYPDFPNFGNPGTMVNLGTPLQWDQIVEEIEVEWRPICYSYPLDADPNPATRSNHMMVIIGYQIKDGQKYLVCLNPQPPDPTLDRTIAWEIYEQLGAGGFKHDRDFWRIQP